MAGSMKTSGTEELEAMLAKLGESAYKVGKAALYAGAGVVADAYTAAVSSIAVSARRWHNEPGGRLPTKEERDALKIGIARFRDSDPNEVTTIVGVPEGYTEVNGRKKATKLIARSINSGTSFMQKQPVFRKAATSSRAEAQAAMIRKADEMIEQLVIH